MEIRRALARGVPAIRRAPARRGRTLASFATSYVTSSVALMMELRTIAGPRPVHNASTPSCRTMVLYALKTPEYRGSCPAASRPSL